ncbi:hypothetical protein [Streptomyces sp. IMTB 2501]|uniref:DinB/UmuC family translesion DNA polymerase n=1 Tax=Streptomyces sp. IMTB 2501 TaxID=1776340 RepID=UPI0021170EA8|nr:hypothetical protein [Streptomyces sp. IMTB 2501]
MIGDGSWMRHHGTDARHLGEILRVRSVSWLGVDLRIGIGPTITVAATASAQIPAPGGVPAIAPDQVADRRGPLPVQDLHGIGPCQAAVLCDYGIHSVGRLTVVCPAASPPTGPKSSTPFQLSRALPASAAVRHRFAHHTQDGAPVRAALLDLVVQLGLMLRRHEQAAQALTLTLKFAGGSSWDRPRRLPEPSGHDEDLRTVACQLMDAAGMQRARLTGIVLKGEDLVGAGQVAQQISLDGAREDRLVAEAAIDGIRARFGPGAIGPAAAFRRAS